MHLRFALASTLLLLGCGTSANTEPADGGDKDGTVSAPTGDGGPDSSRVDGGTDSALSSDSGAAEGGMADSSAAEAGIEASADSGTDSSVDSGPDSGTTADASAEAGPPPLSKSVLMYHNHINRDGFFIDPLITATTAPTFVLDTTFVAPFPNNTDVIEKTWTSPLYVEHGPAGRGTFFVATAGNNLYAVDESTGGLAWPVRNFGTPAKLTFSGGCGNIQPIGITGTPAIDLATNLIVFDAVSADSSGFVATHTIYGVSILDGTAQWSVDVSTLTDPSGLAFSPQPQTQRGAVLIVNGIAYVVYGGYVGDCGVYHGWVVGVPLTGTGAKAWATQVRGAAIWGPGGAASDGQSIFVTTGNGIGGTNVTWEESEGLIRLDPGPTFSHQSADYFTPTNWFTLDEEDLDLSGSGPLVIDAPSMTPSALVMAQGKDGNLYLVPRGNLGGIEADGGSNVGVLPVMNGAISNGGASATLGSGSSSTTYVVVRPNGGAGVGCPNGTSGDLVAVKLDPNAPQKMSVVWCALSGGQGSPIITTSDGTNDAMVWAFGAEGVNQLRSFSLTTGAPVFAGGGPAGTITFPAGATAHHFSTILAANGRIIVSADGGLYAFKSAR